MKISYLTFRKTISVSLSLFFLLIISSFFSLYIGTVNIGFGEIINFFIGKEIREENRIILLSIRIPRILLAIIVGGGLSVAGVIFQALLRNPLAEPFILGVSSGGAFGAVLVLSLGIGFTVLSLPFGSLLGSILVILIVYSVSQRYGRLDPTTLLLTGIMVGAFFNAIILFLITMKHQQAGNAFLWLMGNLANADLFSISIIGPLILLTSFNLYFFSKEFNLIASGEETAVYLGVNVEKLKLFSYIGASLITGLAVSMSGIIGFVGLIIPHINRMIFGVDHRLLIPSAFFSGAIFLILVDMLARTLISPAEIPVGAVTALIGAPIFIWLLKQSPNN